MKFYHKIVILIFISNILSAQTSGLGTWNIVNVKYNIDEKWSVFGEAQLRSLRFYNNFHYYEYKVGGNYKLDKNIVLSLGIGSYQTYQQGGNFVSPKSNDEFRIWPQIILNQSLWKLKLEQRYRAELRFTSDDYKNRFRYRIGLSYPFGKEKKNYKPYQIGISNEIFLTNKEPYFERNRFLTAFSYKPSKTVTLQAGYLHQFDYKIDDKKNSDFLQIGCAVEIFRKSSQDKKSDDDKHEIILQD